MTPSHPFAAPYRPGDPDPPTMPLIWRAGVTPVIMPAAEVVPGKSMSSQMLTFALVGGLSTLIDFGGFNALHFWLGFGPVTAKMLAVSASTLFSYYGNRRWSFGAAETSNHRRDLPLFIGLNGIGLLIALAAVAGTRYGLGLSSALALNVIGNLGGALLGTAFRFWAYRTVVFKVSSPAAPPSPARSPSSVPSPVPTYASPPPYPNSGAAPAAGGRHRRSNALGRARP